VQFSVSTKKIEGSFPALFHSYIFLKFLVVASKKVNVNILYTLATVKERKIFMHSKGEENIHAQ
jgi:hypothetical protein